MSYNWDKGRMVGEIEVTDPSVSEVITHTCEIANRISTRIIYNYKPIHGLNRWNDGVAHLPPEFEWTIGFPGTSPSIRLFRSIQLAGIEFIFRVYDENNSGENGLIYEEYKGCRVTERRTDVVVDDVPAVLYRGIALRVDPKYIDADGVAQSLTANIGSGEIMDDATIGKLFEEWLGA